MKREDMLNNLMENEDSGVIFLDNNGLIKEINEKAKRIVGVTVNGSYCHPSGKIKENDIVIISDTQIGEDDGELEPSDLTLLGIHDLHIKQNNTFVGMGVYKNKSIKPIYKYSGLQNSNLSIDEKYMNHHIKSSVSFNDKTAEIVVDNVSYKCSFIQSYGHIVVIDGESGLVKFVQAKGYSIRKESIREILYGQKFTTKSSGKEIDIINLKFDEIFDAKEIAEQIRAALAGEKTHISNAVYEINKIAFLASIYTCYDYNGQIVGVMIKINELDSIESALMERNKIINAIESKMKDSSIKNKEAAKGFNNIIGNSNAMIEVKNLAYKAALKNTNVIITGESGTGKSLLAKEIYLAGGAKGDFVYVDCSTISPNLFESEMFGYIGGAFTGANPKGNKGFFEAANGGTIFLDEIGEIPLHIQVKLLSVIQNKEIYRVGSTKAIPVNVRIIAATNKNLYEEVENGNFRKDLYYRINVCSINIPPLRECKADLSYMSQKFLDKACDENGLPKKLLSNDAMKSIFSYDWPGNVRELQNVIERAAIFCDDYIIYSEQLKLPSIPEKLTMKSILKNEERRVIIETLKSHNGDKKAAMDELDISKSVFYAKLKEYGIN